MPAAAEQQTDPVVMVRAIWQSVSSLKQAFQLSELELQALLGDMPRSTMHKGMQHQNVKVSRDVRDRVSLLLGIYKGLRVLFEDSQQATTWIDRPNTLPPFNGRRPRELMTSGDFMALASVRRFVDYWRG
jgi:uncharacterized protein (DUF2384 family)